MIFENVFHNISYCRTVCGVRVRVEHSSGRQKRGGGGRGGGAPRRGRDSDRCYECGEPGHLAYECRRRRGGRGRDRRS